MREAAIPDGEAARLEALHGLEILDTLPERAYDDITFIASQLCATPIALVSLVDADRQWFKSRVGLDATETPRAMAFCSHAILEPGEVFVIEDALQDDRFADNPLVIGESSIRFYAGSPLVTSDGHALGTLCVIDREPRKLSDPQRASLRSLARQVVAHLELRRANQQLEHQSLQLEKSRNELAELCHVLEGQADAIERDLGRAETIQRSLLPQELPRVPGFHVQTLYRPGQTIGGDLYDVRSLSDRHVALVIADAVGHGVSAAMLSLLFKHRLRLMDEEGEPLPPGEVLARLNQALIRDLPATGAFVTATCGVLDTRERTVRLASAGHPPTLLLHAKGETRSLSRTGPALGLYPDAIFEEFSVELEHGDRLLLYTDGLFGGGNESPARLREIAGRLRELDDGDGVLDALLQSVRASQPREERDDVTLLLIEARPGESHFGVAPPSSVAPGAPVSEVAPIRFAATPDGTYLALHRRVTWLHGSGLLEASSAAIEAGRALCFDLRDCEYLDSTLLGTLHEIAARADAAGVAMRVHGARAELREAFEELDMETLIAHLDAGPLTAPAETHPLPLGEASVQRQQLRLLRAHEVLAELSGENREEFSELIDGLRAGLSEG